MKMDGCLAYNSEFLMDLIHRHNGEAPSRAVWVILMVAIHYLHLRVITGIIIQPAFLNCSLHSWIQPPMY
jgi:hypothetical protein